MSSCQFYQAQLLKVICNYVSLATHPYHFFTTLGRCLMHITVNMHHSVTFGHVQHAAPGHVAESKQYGGLKNVTTEYQT